MRRPTRRRASMPRRRLPATPSNVATITFDVTVDPERGRRHGHLEPGVRDAPSTVGIVDYPSDDPRHADPQRPDARRRRQPAPALLATKRVSAVRRSGLAGHRRSGRRAALHDHDVQQRRDSGDERAVERQRSDEHDLHRELDAAERLAVRAAGQRRLAAHRWRLRQLDRSHAAAGRARRKCARSGGRGWSC